MNIKDNNDIPSSAISRMNQFEIENDFDMNYINGILQLQEDNCSLDNNIIPHEILSNLDQTENSMKPKSTPEQKNHTEFFFKFHAI